MPNIKIKLNMKSQASKEELRNLTSKGWKYRIYPTKEQEYQISQSIDASDAVYNFLLSQKLNDEAEALAASLEEIGCGDVIRRREDGSIYADLTQYNKALYEKLCEIHGLTPVYKKPEKSKKNDEPEKKFLDFAETKKILVEHLCVENGIELKYKAVKKGKDSSEESAKSRKSKSEVEKTPDYSFLLPELEKKGITYFKTSFLRSYTEITTSSDEAMIHFKSIDSPALMGAAEDLKTAFNNFYAGRAKYPTFKQRSKARDEFGKVKTDRIHGSFSISKGSGWSYTCSPVEEKRADKYVYLFASKKIGHVKMRMHRPLPDTYYLSQYARISKTSDDKYYISFVIYTNDTACDSVKSDNAIGLDMSLSDDYLFIDSNGGKQKHIAFSDDIRRMEEHKKQLQAKLFKNILDSVLHTVYKKELDAIFSNEEISYEDKMKEVNKYKTKIPGEVFLTNNFAKMQKKINVLTAKITRKRDAQLKALAQKIAGEYDIICVEDLDIAEMKKHPKQVSDDQPVTDKERMEGIKYHAADLKNKEFLDLLEYRGKIRKKIQNVNLGKFIEYLQSEAGKRGKKVVKVNRYFPSTQKCSCCGHINKSYAGIRNTSKRVFICDECGFTLDCDVNAAKNILAEGLRCLD